MKRILSVFGILLLCFVATTHYTYANDKSWKYKDWRVSKNDNFVIYNTNGNKVRANQFGFIKSNNNCNTDLLTIFWPAYKSGIEDFEGSNATIQLRIGKTQFKIETTLLSVTSIAPSMYVIAFSNFVAGERLVSLLKNEDEIETTIVAPKELVAKLDVKADTFSLKGYTATMLKSVEFCGIPDENISNRKEQEEVKARKSKIIQSNESSTDKTNTFQKTLTKADQGDAEAQFNLGLMYLNGEKVPQNSEKALFWCIKSAEQGYSNSQILLGTMYTSGENVPQNHRQAIFWYKKSAEQENAYAQFQLGVVYDDGIGVLQDYEQAMYWYTKSAKQGLDSAQLNLALMYDNGKGIPKDSKQAAFWYNKAAEQGDTKAQNNLGVLYERGEGVSKDSKKALYWFEKSAEGGHALAQFKLGAFYEIGLYGVSKDYKQSAYWLKKAAEQGVAEAQFQICRKYSLGQGIIKNYKLAYVWANLASAQGHEGATKMRDLLQNMLTDQDLSEAQELAANIQYKIDHPGGKHKDTRPGNHDISTDSTSISSLEHEPMIYDDGWKTLTENEFTERMQKPVLNINYDTPYDFKLLDKNGNKVGWANTPAEYYKYRQKGNYISSQTTYDQIDVDLFESTAMPLIYLSKAQPSKYSYVKDFPFDTKDPLSVLPVEFYSWVGSDERALVDKAISENRPWRHIDPNARILSETSFELIINYDGDGEEPRYVMNPVVLGDLNDDGYEDIVLDCAHYNVGHSGRYYYFRVLTRTSPNDVLKDITDEVDKSIWKIETTDEATTEANESELFTNSSSSEAILFLENQLACILPPSPLKAIHGLVSEGLIEKKAFAHADSVSYLKAKKAFKVFGMPVSIVSAFDEGDRDNLWHEYFTRAPGTSPGNLIAVIIDWPKDKVKNHIIENEITGLGIGPADYPPYDIKKMEIGIYCNGSFREREVLGVLQSLQ